MTATVDRSWRAASDNEPMPGPANRTSAPAPRDAVAATEGSCQAAAIPNAAGLVEAAGFEQSDLGRSGPAQARPGQLEQLRQMLAQRRTRRLQLEHDGAALPVLARAVALVRRDRDAGTSQTLRRERALFEQLLGDVDELASLLARVSVRLSVLGLPADAPQLRAGLTAGQAGLAALAELAAAFNNADPSSSTAPLPNSSQTWATSATHPTPARPAAAVLAAPGAPAAGPDAKEEA